MKNILHIYKDFEPLNGGGGVARHIYGICENLVIAITLEVTKYMHSLYGKSFGPILSPHRHIR